MSSDKPLLICLMGPTASGKTDLAIELAGRLDCELVSVDSALVYRGLDIGSAKPAYPHHLMDIRDPAEVYSAAEFVVDANRVVADILSRGRTPLLVGGTMLYFKALLEGLSEMPAADMDIRAAIAAEAETHGWPYIHRQLARVDPLAASRIHPHHSQRLSRALEVFRQLWQHLEGECSLEQAVKNAEAATRQLARRQLTWLRKWRNLAWIYTDQAGKRAFEGSSSVREEGAGETPLTLALKYLESTPL